MTRTCSRCDANYYGFHTGQGCVECNCNASGSADLQCDRNGVCPCKNSTNGDKCDMCRENFFNFTSEGCQYVLMMKMHSIAPHFFMFDILFQQSANYAVVKKNQLISFISPFNEHSIMVIVIFGQSIMVYYQLTKGRLCDCYIPFQLYCWMKRKFAGNYTLLRMDWNRLYCFFFIKTTFLFQMVAFE